MRSEKSFSSTVRTYVPTSSISNEVSAQSIGDVYKSRMCMCVHRDERTCIRVSIWVFTMLAHKNHSTKKCGSSGLHAMVRANLRKTMSYRRRSTVDVPKFRSVIKQPCDLAHIIVFLSCPDTRQRRARERLVPATVHMDVPTQSRRCL